MKSPECEQSFSILCCCNHIAHSPQSTRNAGVADLGRYRGHVCNVSVPLLAGFTGGGPPGREPLLQWYSDSVPPLSLSGVNYFKIAPLPVHFSLYGFFIALIAMVIVSLLTEPHSEEVLGTAMTGAGISRKKNNFLFA